MYIVSYPAFTAIGLTSARGREPGETSDAIFLRSDELDRECLVYDAELQPEQPCQVA